MLGGIVAEFGADS